MPASESTHSPLTLQSEALDSLILQTYLNLLTEQDPKVRLQAAKDLATIRGHFAGKTGGSSAALGPTQINQFVSTPEQLQSIMSGLRLLGSRSEES